MSTALYVDFFASTFGHAPYPYQRQLGEMDAIPEVIQAPTGAGKTKAVLGLWLHRRIYAPLTVGRRLVICLPMRALVEQVRAEVEKALDKLPQAYRGLFRVHVMMGGDVDLDWDGAPERACIIIGTQDMLVSRALNRGYAMSPFRWPIHFAYLNNDAFWVFDEVQLMGDAVATTAQLAAFRKSLGTYGPAHSLWMSATLNPDMLATRDHPAPASILTIDQDPNELDSEHPGLKRRLTALKALAPAPHACRLPKGLAAFVREQHAPGTTTLVVVNRVKRASETFRALDSLYAGIPDAERPELILAHSRFRRAERTRIARMIGEQNVIPPAGRIVVATQVVEAGLDITSKLLVTDLAPYSSLVQRFGRCNRAGLDGDARIFWIDRPLLSAQAKLDGDGALDAKQSAEVSAPYEPEALAIARTIVEALSSASPADLPPADHVPTHEFVLRRADLVGLFDTSQDLTRLYTDVSRFVRAGDDTDVFVAWRPATVPGKGKYPTLADDTRPSPVELCPVRIGELREFLTKRAKQNGPVGAWIWDVAARAWASIRPADIAPGMTVIVDSRAGGYSDRLGWAPDETAVVAVPPPFEPEPSVIGDAEGVLNDVQNRPPDAAPTDDLSHLRYVQTLAAHSREARAMARVILEKLSDLDLGRAGEIVERATHHHDWGKAHDVFQKTMYATGVAGEKDVAPGAIPLAKSDNANSRHERPGFRHELASALALLAAGGPDAALVAYLACCHHGKVRMTIRAVEGERPPGRDLRYARGVHEGDTLPATDLGDGTVVERTTLSLAPMTIGSGVDETSWLDLAIELRDRHGPFQLAFLEALVRAADVRASANPQETLTRAEVTR